MTERELQERIDYLLGALHVARDVVEAARAVYENDDFVCEPTDDSRKRDADLGDALAAFDAHVKLPARWLMGVSPYVFATKLFKGAPHALGTRALQRRHRRQNDPPIFRVNCWCGEALRGASEEEAIKQWQEHVAQVAIG